MKAAIQVVCVAAVVAAWASSASAVTIDTVTVGDNNNLPDTEIMSTDGTSGYGAVKTDYRIAKFEVTSGQYRDFLNAVAQTDTYGLYNTEMWTELHGCKIERIGASGSYNYSVAADRADRPVNYISWGDAARFANWMHNGQPSGLQGPATTEDGSYRLGGAVTRADLLAITRNPTATWVIPTEDEWYKAAFHKNDGATGNYFDYPTSSDTTPTNVLPAIDPGNTATFLDGAWVPGFPFYRSEVGDHENSASPYGTFDQAGNVWEWNEAVIDLGGGSVTDVYRGLRGGDYSNSDGSLHADYRSWYDPSAEGVFSGMRLAEVPEPATVTMLTIGAIALVRRRRR
ncbi:MAG: SUMF1/EgtB/PvdO family nonheme iron enzyme [Phycisphaerae bacterium]|nr:SUMF1/EgtB/PvdO family nonheme iron enzyme [Phycisphaerae bacterium]